MAKAKTVYICQQCGSQQPKWQGQCPDCGEWNSLQESVAEKTSSPRFQSLAQSTQLIQLHEVNLNQLARQSTGLAELDRALGGGLVQGAVVLIGGDPGIGKSTLLLQTLGLVGLQARTLYVSGEESAQQIAMRAQRLQVDPRPIQLLAEIRLESILQALEQTQPSVAVIDSIQTLYSDTLQSAPGSVAQVRECAAALTRYAKTHGCTVFLVGHVTKDGSLAGPRVLEHIVDTVLYFEGDGHSNHRLIRATKNRFGAANELGIFAMTERGLRAINNPSAIFLAQFRAGTPGTCVLITQEGTRPLLVEIQALVDEASGGHPKRLGTGVDSNRLAMLLAVLHRHAGLACHDQDVFINAVGGVKISEPAADLAMVMAIASSRSHRALPSGLAMFGEVGLAGEIRPVQRGQERLKEAIKLGFDTVLLPEANAPKEAPAGITMVKIQTLAQALDWWRGQ